MKRLTIMTLALPALAASSVWGAACYDPCGYPGAAGETCRAAVSLEGSSSSGAGCEGKSCPCTSDGDCQARASACQPYVCHAGACQRGAPLSAETACGDPASKLHCDGTGSCVSCSDDVQNGDEQGVDCGGFCAVACDASACSKDASCKSGRCAADVCLASAVSDCMDDAECASSRCLMNHCAPCAAAADCKSQECDAATGRCKVPVGAPCSAADDCANASCNAATRLCQKTYQDDCASPAGCDTGYCHNASCFYCNANAQCTSNECLVMTGSSVGTCTLPQGAYCTPGATSCAAGFICKGFPARCQ